MNHTCMLPNQPFDKAKPHPINPIHILSTQLLSTYTINHWMTRRKSTQLLDVYSLLCRQHFLHRHRIDSLCQLRSFGPIELSLSITSVICLSMFCKWSLGITWYRWQWTDLTFTRSQWNTSLTFAMRLCMNGVHQHWSLLCLSWDFQGKPQLHLQGRWHCSGNCSGSDRKARKAIGAEVAVYEIFWVKTPPKSDWDCEVIQKLKDFW